MKTLEIYRVVLLQSIARMEKKMIYVGIDNAIFASFPGFRRGLVVARNVNNRAHRSSLESMLVDAVKGANEEQVDFSSEPHFVKWDEAHRRFNSNPNKYPPAHKALRKRVQRPDASIPYINSAVAIMNLMSIAVRMPVGGDNVHSGRGLLELRFATGEEEFHPLGKSGEIERPDRGEVIYVADKNTVMCRRWNWRNSQTTAITADTELLVMNVDGILENCEAEVCAARDRVAELLRVYCGATVETCLLSPGYPSYTID